jgi:hydrogenase maturation protease
VLVLGIGNILLGDEGLGVHVIHRLRCLRMPPGVELVDGGTGGADLLEFICGRRKVIVVDAMDAGLDAGAIRRLTLDDLARGDHPAISLHEVSILDAVAMARLLGEAPADLVAIGVQPADLGPGDLLSPVLEGVMPKIIDAVLAECGRRPEA